MANVHCQSCGRTYDYEKYGCCPNCGAYNRRPRREWVDVDGTVHHGARKQEKVCYEKKTCYEEKVCFEEQARPARKKNPLRQLEQELHKAERTVRQVAPRKSHASGKEKASGVIFMAVFIISMLSVMLPSMIRSCQAKIDEGGHGVTVTPAQEETPAEPAEVYYLSQGESFQWYGEEAWVSGYDTTELEDGYMEVSVLLYYPEEREELPEMPELYHSDGISPPLTLDPPDGGDLWRLNFRISTQDTSWLMVEFTDLDDTEYDVILE